MDFDGSGDPCILKIVDNSYHHSKHMMAPASIALRQASTCFSKLADAFVLFFSRFPHSLLYATSGSSFGLGIHTNPSTQRFCSKATPSCFSFPHDSFNALFSHKFPSFFLDFFFRPAAGNVLPLPLLSLAASLIPPLGHFTPSVFAIPPEDDKSPCNAHHRGCVSHALPAFNWPRHAVEPKTGIQFPQALNSIMAKDNQSNLSSEVLVGIGSRIMTIIRIKSLKVYAFGFYVHPSSLCQKLGSKYGSVPVAELKERDDFYADLLREDIGMTVRLVVNYNGMKINTVKDAFEKSLRTRLAKTNPETDFKCISTFGSYFTKDIPLPVGTIIDIRRTADGQLITEIGGNQIGAVHSRELCRAFFDMYLGEVPVSEKTKEEIGRNVATIIRRC